MGDFLEHAEGLWREWLGGPPEVAPGLAPLFEHEACPEPYLDFEAGINPLVVVTTNPGAAMPHQMRAAILEGRSPAHPSMSYAQVARAMAAFYRENLRGTAARRIGALKEIAEASGYKGVLQVECCPWHSPSLPGKTRLLRLLLSDTDFVAYEAALGEFVRDRPTLVVSSVSSRARLERGRLELSPWLKWQVEVLGLSSHPWSVAPLVWRNGRATAAVLVAAPHGQLKALLLMMGSNNLPGPDGRAALVRALRSYV